MAAGMILAFRHQRDFHQQRHRNVGAGHVPQRRHAAAMDTLSDRETIYDGT